VTTTTENDLSPVSAAAEEICNQFKRLWPYQEFQESYITKHILPKGEVAKQAIETATLDSINKTVEEVNNRVRAELKKISPDKLLRDSEHLHQSWLEDWYGFLMDFSHCYAPEGRQRSAEPLLKFLLTSCDHTFWIWRQWTLSCLWKEDYCGAIGLLDAAKKLHEFSSATRHHPYWLCSFAIIKLFRDEDKEAAIEYATRSRDRFGACHAAVQFYKALVKGASASELTAILTFGD
jgi:hypothetical protein